MSEHYYREILKRRVAYFREEMEPIGDGPEYQPDGVADVSVSVAGAENRYSVHAKEIAGHQDKESEDTGP